MISDMENQIKDNIQQLVNENGGVDEGELGRICNRVLLQREYRLIPAQYKVKLKKDIYYSIKKLDVLQEILDDDSVTEIMINGYDNIFIEKNGVLFKYDKQFSSKEKLLDVVQRIAGRTNKMVNESNPIIDTRLEDGSRVNIVMNPIAMDGPAVTIRKFYDDPLTIERLIELGAISLEAAIYLEKLVKARYNIFISGGTGSGKTTFLNALSNFIPKDERVITIEDSAELKLMGVSNLVRLEARSANSEGNNEVSIRDLIKASLRMRPSRIIVGEVRSGEALDMLQAMNTGHDGSLSTGHANGPQEMMLRLETMVLMAADMPIEAIRNQIASAVDIVVHLGRINDGSRKVLSISEVVGIETEQNKGTIKLNTLFEYKSGGVDDREGEEKTGFTLQKTKSRLEKTKCRLKKTEKLRSVDEDLSFLL